ncbi:MAG TPA: TIR domain-containing protein [Nitrososphaeraceae archaeon]|nr:TIR domain-containing protein [Nitrososphaeraceae archaeon]
MSLFQSIKHRVDRNMNRTTVTIVLIGALTSNSRWVRYEIQQTKNKGNGLLRIQIHMLQNQPNATDYHGMV